MKKSLLFVGFSYHLKTGSADFMIDLLKEKYAVAICLIDLYAKTPYAAIQNHKGDYDVVVCWHVMPPIDILRKHISFKHAALFPMADACPGLNKPEKWYPYRHFQFISFSKKLHNKLSSAGFASTYQKYFPEPREMIDWGNQRSAFFWFRRKEINCKLVEMLLPDDVTHLHIHNAPDPDVRPAVPEIDCRINHTTSSWFERRGDAESIIKNSAYYVAPRPKEGIGMSFLEAMGMGRCVIAPNNTTMNEYIKHGVNGLLYNPSKPARLPRTDVRTLQKNALETITAGRLEWIASKDKIFSAIESPASCNLLRIVPRMLLRACNNPLKVLKALRQDS